MFQFTVAPSTVRTTKELLMKAKIFNKKIRAFSLTEAVIVAIIAFVLISTIGLNWNRVTSYLNVSDTQKALLEIRSDINQTYSGSTNFNDLTDEVVLNAKLVPQSMIRGNNIVNAWNGNVTFAPADGGDNFSITLTAIPQGECVKLALFQPAAWSIVEINGTSFDVEQRSVGQVSGACIDGANTLTFTASRLY